MICEHQKKEYLENKNIVLICSICEKEKFEAVTGFNADGSKTE